MIAGSAAVLPHEKFGYKAPRATAGAFLSPELATTLAGAVETVKRSEQANGSAVLPMRWVVERSLARLNRCRRLAKHFENLTGNALALLSGIMGTAVVKHEAEAVPIIRRRVARGNIIHADEARAWDGLHASFEMKRINHRESYSKDCASTNQAESYIARLRRAEIGQHCDIAGTHLGQYAGEMV